MHNNNTLNFPGYKTMLYALKCIAGLFIIFIANPNNLYAANALPKWELGVGLGGITLADYRGSEEYQNLVFPIPYLVYRGRFFKADRNGVRGLLFNSDQFEVNISVNAALSVRSDDNPLRVGMPELDPTFEIGPSINVNLSGETLGQGWALRLPIRSVFAFNTDSIRQIGWLTQPHLLYRRSHKNWNMAYTLGPYWADQDLHDYYYSVAPEFATANRPAFRAKAGYNGFSTQITFGRRKNNIWYGAYIRYDNLSGTAFADSPLLETDHYFAAGFGISWVLAAFN